TGSAPVAPSAIPRLNGETPKELSRGEIEDLIQGFIAGARRAKKAGFDGVMIHMAHGYLIHQFISPLSNLRNDEYGGDFERRARFPLEVLKAFRRELGDDYPITCRFCGDEYVKGGIDLTTSVRLANLLEANGMNAIEVTAGTHETPEVMGAPPYHPMGFLSHLSAAIRKEVKIPVGIVGRIHTPELAERLLREGKADLIAVGRGLIADPEWPRKAKEGMAERIVPCISCNQGCNDRMYFQQDISCTVNPAAGREETCPVSPVRKKKKILIMGGGPAGLEAARIAATRGHEVQLWEKEDKLGGQLNVAAAPPGKEDVGRFRDFLIREVKDLPIKIFHKKLHAQGLKKISPDLVVVAAGGTARKLEGEDFKSDRAFTAWEILSGKAAAGERVVIIGGGPVGLETADFLREKGKSVTILEMLKKVGQDMSPRGRKMMLRKLIEGGVEILVESKAVSFDGDTVVFDRAGVADRINADTIVLAVGTAPAEIRILGLKKSAVRTIGDAKTPRRLFEAMHEAYNLAIEV
ncbi:MAG TPA: FAD-dependent oxidoreductase, partial [Thermodesulfobacteriota bacterium]|nr:FAD-dependent oxidoreductase [Thermodesulfobacteriota bacterium]